MIRREASAEPRQESGAQPRREAPIKVLLADDQILVRAGFRVLLDVEDDITVVGEAADGAEAVSLARAFRPDVVLMDIRMPVLDGIEATRRLVRGLSNPEICRELVISDATAKTHVARILQKLDLRDRVQAVIYAYESGLVEIGVTGET